MFNAKQWEGQFDVVISSAVIEHVLDPVEFLQHLGQALKPNGLLLLSTPNAASMNYRILRSWWRELLSIGFHIYLLEPQSLGKLARQAGFEVVKLTSDYDMGGFAFRGRNAKQVLVWLWACYREMIKRVCKSVSGAESGDILFANLRKVPSLNAPTKNTGNPP
ncbi:Ubiquinone biosynthesis O-methyltransferase [bioreactor metagenome]|uniref:Ubiquinone biosynthesis O-methyltransferase n=1 Tax=bioreactor metagenome TaxID=1076179 RepID=A0A645EWJ4_9ZZZZ